ncbi:hypothetical protein ACQP1K_11850 [Sphaerimonospora sp. CA-214678]|uniref:hypothetical protein n=1 Tax=Sphaerimonospora sp. CA-214678 TaxID=3240029 RepID=UPI003D89DAC8
MTARAVARTNAQTTAERAGTEPEMPVPFAEVVALVEEAGAREDATASGGTGLPRTSETVTNVVSAETEAIVRSGMTEAAHVTGILASVAGGMARETAMNGAVGALVSAVRTATATITATATGIATGIAAGIRTIAALVPLAPMPAVASAAATRVIAAEKADSTIVVSVDRGAGATRLRG